MTAIRQRDRRIAAVRGFNRFYTRQIGVLRKTFLDSPYSLGEARVLYELANRENLAAKEIGIELGLDPGYLSRIVQNFDEKRLITRKPLEADRRQYLLSLTARGRQAFARLDRSSHDEVAAMLAALPRGDGQRLIAAMAAIEREPATLVLEMASDSILANPRSPMEHTTRATMTSTRLKPADRVRRGLSSLSCMLVSRTWLFRSPSSRSG